MKKSDALIMPRRRFIASASCMILGSRLFDVSPFAIYPSQTIQDLKEELTPEELKWVEKSSMAKDIKNYFGKGYSCAESLFIVSLKYLEKPEDLVWIAAVLEEGYITKIFVGFLLLASWRSGSQPACWRKKGKKQKIIVSD